MKTVLKMFLRGFARLLVYPLAGYIRMLLALTRNEQSFQAGSHFLGLFPGLFGIYLRREYYRLLLADCSNDCCIEFATSFAHINACVGKRAYIGQRCTIGSAIIGDDVLIGSNVDILSGRRQHFTQDSNTPIMDQGGEFATISIGCGSWIGNSSVVMADVGENCVVGAGSVVVKPVSDNTVVVGNPAREIRKR